MLSLPLHRCVGYAPEGWDEVWSEKKMQTGTSEFDTAKALFGQSDTFGFTSEGRIVSSGKLYDFTNNVSQATCIGVS